MTKEQIQKRFDKNGGYVFGISSSIFESQNYLIFFDNVDYAEKWISTKENDFTKKQIVSNEMAYKWQKQHVG